MNIGSWLASFIIGRRLTVILEENYSTNPEVPEPKEEWKMYFPKRMGMQLICGCFLVKLLMI